MRANLYIFVFVILFVSLLGYAGYRFHEHQSNLDRFPNQEFIILVPSDDRTFIVNCYLISPPASRNLIKASVTNTATNKSRSFYLEFGDECKVNWIDKTHVNINGLAMDVEKDKHY